MRRRHIIAVVLVLVAVAGVVVTSETRGDPSSEKAAIGQPSPDFKLKDTHGKEFSLGEFKGHIVVLEWVNQDCPYVMGHHVEKRTTQKLYAKYASKGVVWLGVDSTNNRKPEDNRVWAAEHGIAYPILHDSTGKVGL